MWGQPPSAVRLSVARHRVFLRYLFLNYPNFCSHFHSSLWLRTLASCDIRSLSLLSITQRWQARRNEIEYYSLPLTKNSERLEYATISTSKLSSLLLKLSTPFCYRPTFLT